jgi:aconitate hydratase
MTLSPQIQQLAVAGRTFHYVSIADVPGVEQLPFSLRVMLENLLRQASRGTDTSAEIDALLQRRVGAGLGFSPVRVFGQDILGQVMLVDMAGIRHAVADAGGDPAKVSPKVPVDLIIDHSLQVDRWASPDAPRVNLEREYQRNGERFAFLRWCASSFDGVRVVPPGKGIMHQVNLEHLARVVETRDGWAYPDVCLGTDSHTTMVNGLGVLGWGIGGIDAEAAMLGETFNMQLPEVVGFRLTGSLPAGSTARASTAFLCRTGLLSRT